MLRPLNFALSALLVPFSICVSLSGNETTLDAIYEPLHCINHIQATVNPLVHSAICKVEVYGPKLAMPPSNIPLRVIQAPTYWGALEDLCTCKFYGCGKTPDGYKTQSKKTKKNHEKKDLKAQADAHSLALKLAAEKLTLPATIPRTQSDPNVSASGVSSGPNVSRSKDTPSLDSSHSQNRRPDTDEHRDFGYDSDDHFDHQPIEDGHMSDDSHEEDDRLSRQASILPEGEQHHEDSPTPPEVDHHQDIDDLDEPQETAGDIGVLNVELAPGFREHPAIRLLYLQTALGSIYGSDTVVESNNKLTDGLNLIELANPNILESTSSFLKPARTLVTCKRRLGINVDDFIEQRPICTACYKYYAPNTFDALKKPNCTEKKCKGIVYREKRGIPDPKTGKESIKRIPAKIHSYSPILPNIERLLLRPDFVSALRDNKKMADEPLVPDDIPMHDIYDGEAYRTVEIGLRRIIDPDLDGAIADIEDCPGSRKRLILCELGLNMTINMDWCGITDNRPHSCGAVYIAFNDLDRSVRYLPHNVLLVMTIPGPHEPSLEQLNYILSPLIRDLKILYKGILFRTSVYGRTNPVMTHGVATLQACDIPASRKLSGAASHSHKTHPCNVCFIVHDDINSDAGYDVSGFKLRDDYVQLKHAFKSQKAKTKKKRGEILDESGSRHTQINLIPGWLPIRSSPHDFMHNYYSGMVSNFWYDVVDAGYLLTVSQWRDFEQHVNNAIWPSGIGRLPDNLGTNHSLQKADQWRTLLNVQHILLWLVWRNNTDDKIRTTAPEIPSNAKKIPSFKRNPAEVYKLGLYLAVAESILASKAVSMDQVNRAHGYLVRYCKLSLRLGIHLKPNHHLAMHYPAIFRRFGPTYAWWLFAFERFNGYLENVNLNGHAGGIMELTILRNWVQRHRVYEMISNLPANATKHEKDLISRVVKDKSRVRGTFAIQTAGFQGGSSIKKSKDTAKTTNLRGLHDCALIYPLLLDYARKIWPESNIVSDFDFQAVPGSVPLVGNGSATSYPFIYKDGIRFGSLDAKNTTQDQFGTVDFTFGRIPCQFLYHFELKVGVHPPVMCSVIRKTFSDNKIPILPFDIEGTDLRTYVTYANRFHAPEVIPTSNLAGAVVVFEAVSHVLGDVPLWLFQSFDRSGIRPEESWAEDEDLVQE